MSASLLLAWALALQGTQEPPPPPSPPAQQEGGAEKPPKGDEPPAAGTQAPPAAQGQSGDPGPPPDQPPAPPAEEPSAAPAQPVASAPAAPETAPPAPVPAFDRRFSLDELEAAGASLVESHPDLVARRELGHAASGRPIGLWVLGDRRTGDPDARPALLFAPTGSRAGHGAELALALAWRLAERASVDPAVGSLLLKHTVYVLPVADPDGREGGEPGGPRFDASFPLGWLPERLRPGGGALPLDDPAALVAHEFLAAHGNVVLVVSVTDAAAAVQRLWAGAVLPPADAADFATLERLAGTPAPVAWPALTHGGGGFLDDAYQERGILPLAFVEPSGLASDLPAWIDATAARVQDLIGELPRLALALVSVVRLGPGLWQIDVDVENAGALATASVLARERAGARGVTLTVEGGSVVAHAHREGADGVFRVAAHGAQDGIFQEEAIPGGAARRLRFVVEGTAGGAVRLVASSPWSPPAELQVPLQE